MGHMSALQQHTCGSNNIDSTNPQTGLVSEASSTLYHHRPFIGVVAHRPQALKAATTRTTTPCIITCHKAQVAVP